MAVQAGFASLCSQAAVSLVNNKGDVLAVLKDLASDQGMRALASAMLTASLTQGATELADLYKDDKGMVREGFIDLAADTAAFFIPMVPAGMTKLARGGITTVEAAEAIRAADKATDAIKATGRADNVVNGERLRKQLLFEEASSKFSAEGKLTKEALESAKEIMVSSKLRNPTNPEGCIKFETTTSRSPSGDFKVHFYARKGPGGKLIDPLRGLDYKAKLNGR